MPLRPIKPQDARSLAIDLFVWAGFRMALEASVYATPGLTRYLHEHAADDWNDFLIEGIRMQEVCGRLSDAVSDFAEMARHER